MKAPTAGLEDADVTKFRTMLSAAAAIGLSMTAAGVMAVPLNGAIGLNAEQAVVADRVSISFAGLPAALDVPPAIEAAAGRVAKGDFLERPGCFGQVWPDITPECIAKASGAAAAPVRTVTIGYQVGDATTVLVRVPALQTASR